MYLKAGSKFSSIFILVKKEVAGIPFTEHFECCIYSENPVNIRLHRRLRELHWIKELGTAAPYGCNDQIKGVGTLSSPSCKHTNVLGIFNKQQRRKRSHGHRHYNEKTPQLDSSIDTFINLIDSIDQPQGVQKIKTTLFSVSLPKLRELQSLAL